MAGDQESGCSEQKAEPLLFALRPDMGSVMRSLAEGGLDSGSDWVFRAKGRASAFCSERKAEPLLFALSEKQSLCFLL